MSPKLAISQSQNQAKLYVHRGYEDHGAGHPDYYWKIFGGKWEWLAATARQLGTVKHYKMLVSVARAPHDLKKSTRQKSVPVSVSTGLLFSPKLCLLVSDFLKFFSVFCLLLSFIWSVTFPHALIRVGARGSSVGWWSCLSDECWPEQPLFPFSARVAACLWENRVASSSPPTVQALTLLHPGMSNA